MSESSKRNFEKKYYAVVERSFNTKIDVFLYCELKDKRELNTVDECRFLNFLITNEMAVLYEKSWQQNAEQEINGLKIKDYDRKISKWYKEYAELKVRLLKAYTNHFKVMFPLTEFISFYKQDSEERECEYCGITDAKILKLRDRGLIKTKRNRGRQMEIDRINSNMEYSKENVVLACYWCNNAKSDEFSLTEFKTVGKEIRKIWENRLKQL
jgi:5-methylcytosine-specific restriction endonuclease McrA